MTPNHGSTPDAMKPKTSTDPSDLDLVHRAQADPDGTIGRRAVSELLGRYQRRVYLWCFRYVRDHEQALDMAQEVLMKAYRALPGFDGRSGFGSWIFAIARNRCLSELRRPSLDTDELADPDERASPRPGPEAALLGRLEEQELLALIDGRLEPVEQTALWLRCFEKLPVDEITAMLALEESTGARAVLQRARRKLIRALEERRNREGEVGP